MKPTRSFTVKDDSGKTYTIEAYATPIRTAAFGEPSGEVDGPERLSLNGRTVYALSDGRYEVPGTGQFLYKVE